MSDEPRQTDAIHFESKNGVGRATIDVPPINLMGGAFFGALHGLVERLEADTETCVVVFQSADPDFFIAHGDVEVIQTMPDTPQPEVESLPFTHEILEHLRTLPQVTIAQVEGFARGGGSEFTLACDMRFAARGRAVFGQPEVPLGILPGAGGTARLSRLVGSARAMEIILGGDDFSADEAAAYGWVNRALDADELGPFVDALAARIASFPSATLARAKCLIQSYTAEGIEQDLLEEQRAFDALMADPASERGPRMRRFVERGVQTREGERTLAAACLELGHD